MDQSRQTDTPQALETSPRAAFSSVPPPRTFGLRAFDAALYPGITNVGVFLTSVAATYLTNKGGLRGANGELVYGRLGEFFQKRGDWLRDKLTQTGMSHEAADTAKMVVFSFADGSLLAPVVKGFEDRREQIAHGIDRLVGTEPEDMSVYRAEPKQSWGSVLGGRLITAIPVVLTATTLEKTHLTFNGERNNLNHHLFYKPGIQLGEWIKARPQIAKHFGRHDVSDISRVTFFEAFYTSVCTAGLYLTSRFIASRTGDKPPPVATASHHGGKAALPDAAERLVRRSVGHAPAVPSDDDITEKPDSKLHHIAAAERVQTEPEALRGAMV